MTIILRIGVIALAVLGSASAALAAERHSTLSQRYVAGEQRLSFSPNEQGARDPAGYRVHAQPRHYGASQQALPYLSHRDEPAEGFFRNLSEWSH